MIVIDIDFTTKQISATTTNDLTIGASGGGGGSFNCADLNACTTIQQLVADKHTHPNKALLDTYTQTDANITDAIEKKHTHSNKSILDAITEAFTTTLKSAYDGAVSWITTNGNNLINHLTNTSNPHSTTASQVGAYTTSEVDTALNSKVDKVTGLQLSQESYTTTEKNKLASIPSFWNYVRTSDTANVSGTTVETLIESVLIPSGTYANGGILNLIPIFQKGGVNGTWQVKIYIGQNASNLTGASIIATSPVNTAGTWYGQMRRSLTVGVNYVRGFPFATASMSDIGTSGILINSIAFNPNIDNYIHYTITLGSANPLDFVRMIGNSASNF